MRTRGWNDDELDAGEERLRVAGWLDGERAQRRRPGRRAKAIERATDRQMAPAIEALGDDLDELVGLLRPWGVAIREVGRLRRRPGRSLARPRRLTRR